MRTPAPTSVALLALQTAVVAFADELLRLPSAASAVTALDLLYGRKVEVGSEFLGHVNGPVRLVLTRVLAAPPPLATLLPERLRLSSACRTAGQTLKGARAAARGRYRELQTAFVTSSERVAPDAGVALLRYTYGMDGRHWLWADAARRLLDRVVALNRAVLGLLASMARGESSVEFAGLDASVSLAMFDLPDDTLDVLAEVLPPLAVPDFGRLTEALQASEAALREEEAMTRYESLFAEILGLRHAEVGA